MRGRRGWIGRRRRLGWGFSNLELYSVHDVLWISGFVWGLQLRHSLRLLSTLTYTSAHTPAPTPDDLRVRLIPLLNTNLVYTVLLSDWTYISYHLRHPLGYRHCHVHTYLYLSLYGFFVCFYLFCHFIVIVSLCSSASQQALLVSFLFLFHMFSFIFFSSKRARISILSLFYFCTVFVWRTDRRSLLFLLNSSRDLSLYFEASVLLVYSASAVTNHHTYHIPSELHLFCLFCLF